MYLLSRNAGKNNTEIGEILGGIHNSSIGRTITRVVGEISESKNFRMELSKISELYVVKKN